jgi:hypothetical protein
LKLFTKILEVGFLSFCGGTRDVEGEKEGERKREKCQKL